jgi:DNA-binding transcriptional LysR family regulator
MDRLLSMRAFAQVVEAGSFSAAATRLDVDAAVVTRLVADLEAHLGVRLLNRTTRSLSLTVAGEDYLPRCRQILLDVDNTEALVSHGHQQPSGRVRIGAPVLFGLEILGPRLSAFRRKYPEILLDLLLLDRPFDLVAESLDLAITLAEVATSTTVVARRLYEVPLILCAAPRYLKKAGNPHRPEDLAKHACLSLSNDLMRERWTLESEAGEHKTVNVNVSLWANNTVLLRDAARQGLGLAVMAERAVRADLDAGTLVRVLPQWTLGRMSLSLLYPSRDFMPGRTRAVIDFIIEERQRLGKAQRAMGSIPR